MACVRGAVCAWGSVGSARVKCLRGGTRAGTGAVSCCAGGSADAGAMVDVPLTVQERILEYCTGAFGSNPAVGRLTVVCRAWIHKLAHVRQVYLLQAAFFHDFRRREAHLQPGPENTPLGIYSNPVSVTYLEAFGRGIVHDLEARDHAAVDIGGRVPAAAIAHLRRVATETSYHAGCCWQLVEAAQKDWSSEP